MDKDVAAVAAWLKCPVEGLVLRKARLPLARFAAHVSQCKASYAAFPAEARRTRRIANLLRQGEPARPVYVEENDPHLFVLEGRHRIVAFDDCGHTEVDVVFVSKRTSHAV